MTLKITGTTMTSDRTAHTARHAPSGHGREVSWLPGQMLDGNTAVTAMVLADITGRGDLPENHRLWPHIHGWAAELGLTGHDAIARASQPPRHQPPAAGTSSSAPRPRGSPMTTTTRHHDRPTRRTTRQPPADVPTAQETPYD